MFEENGWSIPTNLTEYESLAKAIQSKGMHVFSYGSTGWQPTHEHIGGLYLNSYAGPANVSNALIGEKKGSYPEFVAALELLRKHMVDYG